MNRIRPAVGLAAIAAAFLAVPEARGDESVAEVLHHAERDEAEGNPEAALALYRRIEADHPTDRLTRRAKARAEWLVQRNEGAFGPLGELLRARARFAESPNEADVHRFAERVETFPSGPVRREARQLVADTWLTRLHRPSEALAAYEAWRREPGLDDAERPLAEAGAALARQELGHTTEALERLRDAGLSGRAEARFLRAERIGRVGRGIGLGVVGGYALGLAVLVASRRRPFRFRDVTTSAELGVAALALGLPVGLVELYDETLTHAFAPAMGACFAVLVTSWFAAAATAPSPRVERALRFAGPLAVIAAAFLAVSHTGLLTELLMAAWEPRTAP